MVYKNPNEMKDRPCPNGWAECAVCKHERDCRAGLYHGEAIIKAAEIAEKSVIAEAKESAEKIRGTWFDSFIKMTPEESMNWFYSNRTQGLHHVEVMPLDGPSSPGGGGMKNVKKPTKGCKPTIYKWNEFK